MKKAKLSRPHWEVKLWLATDGEVQAAPKMPAGDPDSWLMFVANPPLTQGEADLIVSRLCDLSSTNAMGEPARPAYYYRSDPRTQVDLSRLFRQAVEREAAKR